MTDTLLKEERRKRSADGHLPAPEAVDVSCPKCGRANPVARTFCGGCGQRLCEPCPECGGRLVPGERFCGACGVDLEKQLEQRRHRCERQLREAAEYRQRSDFDAALSRLKAVATVDDPRLQACVQQAAEWLQEVTAEKDRWRKIAEEARLQAEQHLAEYRHEEAVAALERLPEPLRPAHLLAEARAKRDEVAGLTAAIRDAVRAGELQELPASINRLLELQPGHEMAKRLARQLRDRLVAAAKKKLAVDEFAAALRVLEKIPESELDEEVEAVRDQGRELDWLLQDVKLAPAVDAPLVALAERLVKLRPGHREAAELLTKLRVRFREPPADRRHSAPAWASPRQPRFGFPVHGLAGLQRILRSPEIDARLRQTPGRWSVACGLALQALDQAAVPLNLVPAKEAGLLTKLPFLRRKTATFAWGLDFGATGVKAVRLTLDPQPATVTLDAVERLDFPGQFAQLTDAVERRRLQLETLQQFVQRHSLSGERIGVSISGRQTLGRFVELPSVESKRMDDLLRHEASVQYPVNLQELVWGYHVLPRPAGDQAEPVSNRVVLQAVKRHHVQELLSLCQDAGLSVDVLQSDSLALHNFAVYEFFGGSDSNGASSPVVVLLDVGAQSASLVLSAPHLVWFRNLAVAGESFTSALLRPLKLTREQAEQLKREPARARRVYALYELWDPILAYLADEVERSLATCKRQFPGLAVRQMFGLGGGFQLHGVLRRLSGQ